MPVFVYDAKTAFPGMAAIPLCWEPFVDLGGHVMMTQEYTIRWCTPIAEPQRYWWVLACCPIHSIYGTGHFLPFTVICFPIRQVFRLPSAILSSLC